VTESLPWHSIRKIKFVSRFGTNHGQVSSPQVMREMNGAPKKASTIIRDRSLSHPPAPTLWTRLAENHPVVCFFIVIIWPNALWSIANLLYNENLIVERFCKAAEQQQAFLISSVTYSGLTWLLGMGVCVWLILPLHRFFQAQQRGEVPEDVRRAAQRRLVNLPIIQLYVNALLWLPGGFFFPIMIYLLGGDARFSPMIPVQFLASFSVSAVVTTFQAFVFLERYLMVYLYPRIFTDIRPVEVEGAIQMPFQLRLWFLWGAVALGPIIVLTLIAANLLWPPDDPEQLAKFLAGLIPLSVGVVVFGIVTGGMIFWMVGRDVASWLEKHIIATREISLENFDVRIAGLRSDEWGRLTDSFNKMAEDLGHGKHVRETFGLFVGPDRRDEILRNYSELGGKVQDITVMFADIRGFTSRSAGKSPEHVVSLLNRFLSLSVQAVDGKGGWVDKFLGDGFMALFGAPPRPDHADLAVAAARDLLERLEHLNRDLEKNGQPPLRIGVGIHTGPALVGCIGAPKRMEFTAIGETVNLTQRLEELTKTGGATLVLSEATRKALQNPVPLASLGPQQLRGSKEPMIVHTIT